MVRIASNRLIVVVGDNAPSTANAILSWAPHISTVCLLVSEDKNVEKSARRITHWLQSGKMSDPTNPKHHDKDLFISAPHLLDDRRIDVETHTIPQLNELPYKRIDVPNLTELDVIDIRPGGVLHTIKLIQMVESLNPILHPRRPKICISTAHQGEGRLLYAGDNTPPMKPSNQPTPKSLTVGTTLQLSHGEKNLPTGKFVRPIAVNDEWVERGNEEEFTEINDETTLDKEVRKLPLPLRAYYEPKFDPHKVRQELTKFSRSKPKDWEIQQKIIGNKFEAFVAAVVTAWRTSRNIPLSESEIWTNLEWPVDQKGQTARLKEREVDLIVRVSRSFALISVKVGIGKKGKKLARAEIPRVSGESELLHNIPPKIRHIFVVTTFKPDDQTTENAKQAGVQFCSPSTLWNQLDEVFGVGDNGL